jgi:hypothetical protein
LNAGQAFHFPSTPALLMPRPGIITSEISSGGSTIETDGLDPYKRDKCLHESIFCQNGGENTF